MTILAKIAGFFSSYLMEIALAAMLGVGAWGGVMQIERDSARREVQTEKGLRAIDKANATAAALSQMAAFRATEQAWQIKLSKAQDDADARITKARADAAIADASAGRLQQRVAALIAQARAAARNPASPATSPAADDPTGMLADVLGRCVSRVRLLATVADERGIAGSACQQSYEALTP